MNYDDQLHVGSLCIIAFVFSSVAVLEVILRIHCYLCLVSDLGLKVSRDFSSTNNASFKHVFVNALLTKSIVSRQW